MELTVLTVPGQASALSCRLYRDAAGQLAGAPSVEDLRRALEQANADDQSTP